MAGYNRFIVILALLLILPYSVEAQIQIVPRAKIENLAEPVVSAESSSRMAFSQTSMGPLRINENDAPMIVEYEFENISDKPFSVLKVVTTCACVKPEGLPMVVQPGETAAVKVRYYPKGHPGKFERRMFVFTDFSGDSPAAVLKLNVETRAGGDLAGSYPVQKGYLRLTTDEISFSAGHKEEISVIGVNAGTKALRIGCDPGMTPACISFTSIPETVPPGETVELVFRYDPSKDTRSDFKDGVRKLPFMLSGLNVPPSSASINIIVKE